MPIDEPRAANLANWNERVGIHTGPGGYEIDRLVSDATYITDVVRFDRAYLPDVAGKSLLHLQCHIGTDTLSWAKLGARVTGLDFSPPALAVARDLAARLEVPADFVESELYDASSAIHEQFDLVYTGVGAIGWLPDVREWARVVAGFVRPGGTFYIRDMHPMLATLDDERTDGLLVVAHPYFETPEPLAWDTDASYVGSGTLTNRRTYEWPHGLGQTIQALLDAGFSLDRVDEHTFLDWKALPQMVATDGGRFVLPNGQRNRVPTYFSLRCHQVRSG